MPLSNTLTEVVDLAVLSSFDDAQIEGEPDFVVELIDLYLDQTPRLLDALRNSLENNDRLTTKRAAHSLQGSSGNLGILQVAAIADQLEHLEAEYDIAAKELFRSLEDEFSRAKEILLAERQRRSA